MVWMIGNLVIDERNGFPNHARISEAVREWMVVLGG